MANELTSIWLCIGGVVLAIILLAAFWRKIVRALLLLAGLGVVGLIAWAFAQQATATKQVATAANTIARSNVAGNVIVIMLLLLGLIVIGAGIMGYIYLRRRLTQDDELVPWMSAPNVPYQLEQRNDMTQQVNMLVQLEVLQMLRELRAPQSPAMLVRENDGDGDADTDSTPLWW
ncbi:MAG: hypothetical protein JXR84_08475 [Anaerolineae bacterium]|nr:hypothetical protein [Anaerolineae bacterium]